VHRSSLTPPRVCACACACVCVFVARKGSCKCINPPRYVHACLCACAFVECKKNVGTYLGPDYWDICMRICAYALVLGALHRRRVQKNHGCAVQRSRDSHVPISHMPPRARTTRELPCALYGRLHTYTLLHVCTFSCTVAWPHIWVRVVSSHFYARTTRLKLFFHDSDFQRK
jgi:hypothetical protein